MSARSKKYGGARKQLLPWASAAQDGTEKAFIQVGLSLLLDKRYQALSGGAKHTYSCMLIEARGQRNFAFPRATAQKYGIASTTLVRHVQELKAAGFIELVSSGQTTREPNLYSFSLEWKSRAS